MHPNTFLRTFWRAELKPQVFVAMSFADKFKPRFDNVIAPAIRQITLNGVPLEPYRVDLSKTGDSILTDIMDGIAHAQFVLADVSTVGIDSENGFGYRNANVLYEVGIALACRVPEDVLLLRSDNDHFLFDVSTIPHMTLDFADAGTATQKLQQELLARLKQQQLMENTRIQMAISTLTNHEISVLKAAASMGPNQVIDGPPLDRVSIPGDVPKMVAIPRLLDKQLIRLCGQTDNGIPAYIPTPFGLAAAAWVTTRLPTFTVAPITSSESKEASHA